MVNVIRTIKNDVLDFKKLTPQIRFLLMFQLIVLLILSILVGVLFSPKFKENVNQSPVNLSTVPTPMPSSQNILSLAAEREELYVGQIQTVDVLYDGDMPKGVDVVIVYDPNVFEVDTIRNGTVFKNVIQSRASNGQIVYSATPEKTFTDENKPDAIQSDTDTKKESEKEKLSDILFSFTLRGKEAAQFSPIRFVDGETVIAGNSYQNIVGKTETITVTVKEP